MKTLIRLVIILFIIGTVLTMVAFANGVKIDGITEFITDDESYGTALVFESETSLDKLDIDLDTRNIEISVTTEDHIVVTYHEQERDTWILNELNGTLSVKQTVETSFFNWFNFKIASYEVRTVYIEIPASWVLEYSLVSNTGNIKYIEGPTTATDLSVDSNTGNLTLKNVNMDSLLVRMDTGNVLLEDLEILGNLDAESDTGNITLNDVISLQALLETETGNITMTNLTATLLSADTATDNIALINSAISGAVTLSTNTGNITVTNTTGTGFDLTSDTGNIRYTSTTSVDLRYDLRTTTGKVLVNGDDQGSKHSTSTGTILLKAKTTTGNITINVQD